MSKVPYKNYLFKYCKRIIYPSAQIFQSTSVVILRRSDYISKLPFIVFYSVVSPYKLIA